MIKEKNQIINGQREGYWERYHPNGQLSYKGYYKKGLGEGYWEEYYSNGKFCYKGFYFNF